ncbi:MAG: type IV pilin N-terminal domain-containing protein [Methanobacteriota archaeon]|nr:MAG: type IV pilin N-terminal domain-containing protein [Euryarchaeota archaeon]
MKRVWAFRKDAEAVSPVIATILMVAITVVLAAVLYVMVLGFGGTSTTTPTATYSKSTISNGQTITIVSITKTDVGWDDIKVQLTDGTNFAEWTPATTDLDGGAATSYNYSVKALGTLSVCCMVFDVGGNGYCSGTDYFRVYTYPDATAFASSTTYTAVLIYEPTGEQMGTGVSFTG